jgi:hypothetical protein
MFIEMPRLSENKEIQSAGILSGAGAHWYWLSGLVMGLLMMSFWATKLMLPSIRL